MFRAFGAVIALLALGCGDGASDSESTNAVTGMSGVGGASGLGGMSGASGVGSSAPSAPTFTRVWLEVLEAKGCAGEFCHGAGTGTLSMDDPHDAYINLVGVVAMGAPCAPTGQLRVSPGQPDASLLLDKLSHVTPSCGDPMPIGTRLEPDCLDPSPAVCNTAAEIELVRAWIAAGALEN